MEELYCIFDKDQEDYVRSIDEGETVAITGKIRRVGNYWIELIGCIPNEEAVQ